MSTKITVNHVSVTTAYGFFEQDGVYHRTLYSRAGQGFRTYPTEAAVRAAIADSVEEDRQCDEDDTVYSRLYNY